MCLCVCVPAGREGRREGGREGGYCSVFNKPDTLLCVGGVVGVGGGGGRESVCVRVCEESERARARQRDDYTRHIVFYKRSV